MLTFTFTKISGSMTEAERLTSGMVGKRVRFRYSPEWETLNKTAVFTDGYVTRVVPNVAEETVIPSEVLKTPGRRLVVGIYGKSADGHVVIPTLRVEGPMVEQGIDPFAQSVTTRMERLHSLIENMDLEQLLVMIGDISDLDTDSRASLVEAVNELAARPIMVVDQEKLQKAVQEYLEAHPDTKNAYHYALEGGFTGTEEEFARKMAKDIPDPYILPVATADTLGGVKPAAMTDDMTRSVGVDGNGRLWASTGGFGYGEAIAGYQANTEAAMETVLLEVMSGIPDYTTKQIRCNLAFLGAGGDYLASIYRSTANDAVVTFRSMLSGGVMLQKVYVAGVWQSVEWVNPPMVQGVEYRTVERYNGKSVYAKVVDLGTLPASGEKGVTYVNAPSKKVVSLKAYAIAASGTVNQFPFYNSAGTLMGKVSATASKVYADAFADMSGSTGFAVIKFTKD